MSVGVGVCVCAQNRNNKYIYTQKNHSGNCNVRLYLSWSDNQKRLALLNCSAIYFIADKSEINDMEHMKKKNQQQQRLSTTSYVQYTHWSYKIIHEMCICVRNSRKTHQKISKKSCKRLDKNRLLAKISNHNATQCHVIAWYGVDVRNKNKRTKPTKMWSIHKTIQKSHFIIAGVCVSISLCCVPQTPFLVVIFLFIYSK